MIRLKGCTKCGGDINLENDMYGYYVSCLQCGNVLAYLDTEDAPQSIDSALYMAATAVRKSA